MPILIILIVIFAFIVGGQNSGERVTLQLFNKIWPDLPLVLVLIEAIAFGVVITILIYIVNEILLRRRIWRQNHEIKRLKEEVKALQNFPLTEESGEGKSET
jgi:uncharacterized integral membrane protein